MTNRKRPKNTNTNARQAQIPFNDISNINQKRSAIPKIIDGYNHYMNGVGSTTSKVENPADLTSELVFSILLSVGYPTY